MIYTKGMIAVEYDTNTVVEGLEPIATGRRVLYETCQAIEKKIFQNFDGSGVKIVGSKLEFYDDSQHNKKLASRINSDYSIAYEGWGWVDDYDARQSIVYNDGLWFYLYDTRICLELQDGEDLEAFREIRPRYVVSFQTFPNNGFRLEYKQNGEGEVQEIVSKYKKCVFHVDRQERWY